MSREQKRQIVRRVLDIGGNDGKRSQRTFPGADITVLDLKNGFDVTKSPPPKGRMGCSLC